MVLAWASIQAQKAGLKKLFDSGKARYIVRKSKGFKKIKKKLAY